MRETSQLMKLSEKMLALEDDEFEERERVALGFMRDEARREALRRRRRGLEKRLRRSLMYLKWRYSLFEREEERRLDTQRIRRWRDRRVFEQHYESREYSREEIHRLGELRGLIGNYKH
jgi:hypothetical protein